MILTLSGLFFSSTVTELQKEEEEEEESQTDGPSAPPISSSLGPDSSHPYYDIARHGIIQVSGQ